MLKEWRNKVQSLQSEIDSYALRLRNILDKAFGDKHISYAQSIYAYNLRTGKKISVSVYSSLTQEELNHAFMILGDNGISRDDLDVEIVDFTLTPDD